MIMKKITYLVAIFLLMLATSSLTSGNEKSEESTAMSPENNCSGKSARSSSCDGCHSGSGTGGPIIIIYSDGKKSPTEMPIEQGRNDVLVVNESLNNIAIDALKAYLASHHIQLVGSEKNVVKNEEAFYNIHGLLSEEIIRNLQVINIESPIKQSISIKNTSMSGLSVLQTSKDRISCQIEMNIERQTEFLLFDNTGQILQQNTSILRKGSNSIDLEMIQELSGGFYVLLVRNSEDEICTKLLIP